MDGGMRELVKGTIITVLLDLMQFHLTAGGVGVVGNLVVEILLVAMERAHVLSAIGGSNGGANG